MHTARNRPLLARFLFVCHCLALAVAVTASAQDPKPKLYKFQPGPDLHHRLQGALVQSVPGDVFEFDEGLFQLPLQLDIATDNITIRGRGPDKTTLSFKGQRSGNQGIQVTGNNFVIEGLAVEDTAGNAIKVIGSKNVTFRNVRTEWTGEAKSSNGAYGIYPVQCENVLIDGCIAIGASDSGIYVGQSRRVIVRNCHAERNVAGIEIENTVGADVYENMAADNAGGILVFDLPGLQLKAGSDVRVFRNKVVKNNHPNFAAPGNMVANVAPGTGVMVMATDRVEIFENKISGNQTANIALVSYKIAQKKKHKGSDFDEISEGITIRDNNISDGGANPSGEFGLIVKQVLGAPLPDIVYDGIRNKKLLVDGKLPTEHRLSITNNGEATFANFNLAEITPQNLLLGRVPVQRDLADYQFERPSIQSVALQPHDPPQPNSRKQVTIYRTAPKRLSEWGLFKGNGSTQEPVEGVIPYDLNTPLFTDHTNKHRFIRVPKRAVIEYRTSDTLEFPDGTVIVKTFAYPHDMNHRDKGERLLETRIEFRDEGEWYGYSYLWNEEQTDAVLTLGGAEIEVSTIGRDGNHRTNRYEIPNANQCLDCHSKTKRYVPLGPTAANMNRIYSYSSGDHNQLDYLEKLELLSDLPEATDRPTLRLYSDPDSGDLNARARAWLHVNCAHCHSPEGTARMSGLDLSLSQSDPAKLGFWKSPVAAGHGSGGREYDIVPGRPDESILLYRLESLDPSIRMPNVARNQTPTEAIDMIREWIKQMPVER